MSFLFCVDPATNKAVVYYVEAGQSVTVNLNVEDFESNAVMLRYDSNSVDVPGYCDGAYVPVPTMLIVVDRNASGAKFTAPGVPRLNRKRRIRYE